jgi:hypothetical protein
MDLWNEVCRNIDELRKQNVPESYIQSFFENVFVELGWSKLRNELVPQQEIPIGAANRLIPDIIIKSGNQNLFVVELKRPSIESTDRHSSQLRSYMLQLKLAFGIYIGENIQVFFDNPTDNIQPQKIVVIPFSPDNTDGDELFHLLTKQNYSEETMIAYCGRKTEERFETENANAIINELVSGNSPICLTELLISALTERYSTRIAQIVEERIFVTISRKADQRNQESVTQQYYTNTPFCSVPAGTNEIKIGAFAKTAFAKLLTENRLTPEELNELCDRNFSKTTFKAGWPILRVVPHGMDASVVRKDRRGYSRYGKEVYASTGTQYLISTQWVKDQRHLLEMWLSQKGI